MGVATTRVSPWPVVNGLLAHLAGAADAGGLVPAVGTCAAAWAACCVWAAACAAGFAPGFAPLAGGLGGGAGFALEGSGARDSSAARCSRDHHVRRALADHALGVAQRLDPALAGLAAAATRADSLAVEERIGQRGVGRSVHRNGGVGLLADGLQEKLASRPPGRMLGTGWRRSRTARASLAG